LPNGVVAAVALSLVTNVAAARPAVHRVIGVSVGLAVLARGISVREREALGLECPFVALAAHVGQGARSKSAMRWCAASS
jgi:hypothetical protein